MITILALQFTVLIYESQQKLCSYLFFRPGNVELLTEANEYVNSGAFATTFNHMSNSIYSTNYSDTYLGQNCGPIFHTNEEGSLFD